LTAPGLKARSKGTLSWSLELTVGAPHRIYRVFDKPVGPHTMAMFEVNLFTPAQFGAFIPWLVINRGPLSALVHPNHEDGDALRDHSQRATWLGERVPLDLAMLKRFMDRRKQQNGTAQG
jgi:aromatic ring-cleaving dioxygenase